MKLNCTHNVYLESVWVSESKSTFVLICEDKSVNKSVFYYELYALPFQFVGRIIVYYVFTQAKIENELFGRIDNLTFKIIIIKFFLTN